MSGFEYDETRKDPAFRAVMQTAGEVKTSCDKGNCLKCGYHRPGEESRLVVCFCEKLADALITKGLIVR